MKPKRCNPHHFVGGSLQFFHIQAILCDNLIDTIPKINQMQRFISYFLKFCPLVLGKNLMLQGEIKGPLYAEHSIVVDWLWKPLNGLLHIWAFIDSVISHQTWKTQNKIGIMTGVLPMWANWTLVHFVSLHTLLTELVEPGCIIVPLLEAQQQPASRYSI